MSRPRYLFLLLLLGFASLAWSQQGSVVPGSVLVMLAKGAEPSVVVADMARSGALGRVAPELRLVSAPMRIWRFAVDHTADQQGMLRAVRAHPQVQMAQLEHRVSQRALPNDPQIGSQWHHANTGGSGGVADADIDSDLAWNVTTGGTTQTGDQIVVCVVEAADLLHPDLAANAWSNVGEIDNNGVDDDGNGYVDDVRGWDPSAGNDNAVYSGTHGTQVAGMLGARGNNSTGISGISQRVKIMPVAINDLTESAVIAAYTYPLVMRRRYNDSNGATGAFVVATNSSWGLDQAFAQDFPLWCAMYDSLGSEGVLNCVAASNASDDLDQVGGMPSACTSQYTISVTATNRADVRSFGGYGAISVDLAAPGAAVYTTTTGNAYGAFSGTSFATPLVSGTVALLYAVPCSGLITLAKADPAAGARAVKAAILGQVDDLPGLANSTTSGGRLNANSAVQYVLGNCAGYANKVKLQAKLALQGPYNTTTGQMSDGLRSAGLIPLTEPYTAMGHTNAGGGGGESTTSAVLAVTGGNAVVDWIRVELRSPAAPQAILASAHGLLQRDGDIVGTDGVSPLQLGAAQGAYHVVVQHRNHLGCMTAAPIAFATAAVPLDLRSTALALYGSQAQALVTSNTRALWCGSVAGSVSMSTLIKYTGTNNDRDPILTAVGGTVPTQTISGYVRADVNMDGVVRYTGSGNDRDPILVNIGGAVPTAVRVEQLP